MKLCRATGSRCSNYGRAERRKLLSQKELGRYEINRRALLWSSCDVAGSQPGNREQLNGRLEKKLEQLTQRRWKILGRGQEEVALIVEEEKGRYEELIELAEMRRDQRGCNQMPQGTLFLREKRNSTRAWCKQNGPWWQSELK